MARGDLIGTLPWLLFVAAAPAMAEEPDVFTADDAVRAAFERSPDLSAAAAAVDTAQGRARDDRFLLANPELAAWASLTTPQQQLDVTQPLSLTGEGWHARAADGALVEARQASLGRARLAAAHDTRAAWADAVLARARTTTLRESLDQATRLRTSVERRRALDEASDLDVRLAVLSEATAGRDWLEARHAEDDALLALIAVCGPLPSALPADPSPAAPAGVGAPEARADLTAAAARVRAAEAELARARAAVLPAIGVGASIQRQGAELSVGPAVSMALPLWRLNREGRATARGDLAALELEQRATVAVAEATPGVVEGRVRDAEAVRGLSGVDLLAEGSAALAAVDAGYRGGELDLSDAIQLRRQILDGESAVIDLSGELVHARLDLLLANEDAALLPENLR